MHYLLQQQPARVAKTRDIEVVERADDGGVITINTPAVDRDQDRVFSAGARLENYAKNPVVQWGHNYRDPYATIGQTVRMEQTDQHLKARFKLRPAANEHDPQNIVRLLWTGGWIRTASIGFAPVWGKAVENEFGGIDFKEWDLLEWSLVPVPANQEALRNALKGLGDATELLATTASQIQQGAQPASLQLRSLQPTLLLVNHVLGTAQLYTVATTTANEVRGTNAASWDGAHWTRLVADTDGTHGPLQDMLAIEQNSPELDGPGNSGEQPAPAQPTGEQPAPAPVQGDMHEHDDALPSDEPPSLIELDTTAPAPGNDDADNELTPEQEEQVVDALLEVVNSLRRPLEE